MKKNTLKVAQRAFPIFNKLLIIFVFFISVKFSANANEILGDDGNNTLHDCKIINPKVLYSKNNMKTFYNGKNAHHAGAYYTAFRILMPLAEQGHKRAQTGIGLMYLHGNGVEKNESKALEWFKEATCQNHDWAFYHLGTMYYYGMSVEQSYEKSFEYFQKASLINNATAFLNLGHFYQEGKGVQKDDLLALKNYKKALQLGEIDAAFYLGEILLSSEEISNDNVMALMWFKVTQLSGDEDADLIIDYLEDKISIEDTLEAKEMAEKCVLSGYLHCDIRQL